MLKYHKTGNILFLIHIIAFFVIACFINESYNIAFIFFVVLFFIFIESQVRYFLYSKKTIEIENKEKHDFIIKHVNEDISLSFAAKKSDFKNKQPLITHVQGITSKFMKTWIDDNTLRITFQLTDPYRVKLSDILFIERDLLNFHNISYVHCEKEQSIIVLPEPVRNKMIEQKIIQSGLISAGHDYISSIRDYQQGDNFKNINWKQTSKHNEFKVNHYYAKDKPQITLVIDTFMANRNRKAFSLLIKNLTHLLLYSSQKNTITSVIFEGKTFNLISEKQELFTKLAIYEPKKKLFKKSPIFLEQKNTLILTTRKNLNMKNSILVEHIS